MVVEQHLAKVVREAKPQVAPAAAPGVAMSKGAPAYSVSMSAADPTDRHREKLDALGAAILNGRAVLPGATRQAAARNDRVPEPFADLVDTIHRHAYRVMDRMVDGLAEAGASDDEVFEVSVAAAYGAARERLEAGLRAVRDARGDG